MAVEKLTYGAADSEIGKLMIVLGDAGVRALLMQNSHDLAVSAAHGLTHDLTHGLAPGAALEPHRNAERLAQRIADSLADAGRLDIAVDLRGDAFQMRVWRALMDIPRGSVVSYGELAKAIGAPGSARAVGRACATNLVAVLVPCHRVVRSDGGLSGYRWGKERKQRLLELEGALLPVSRAA